MSVVDLSLPAFLLIAVNFALGCSAFSGFKNGHDLDWEKMSPKTTLIWLGVSMALSVLVMLFAVATKATLSIFLVILMVQLAVFLGVLAVVGFFALMSL